MIIGFTKGPSPMASAKSALSNSFSFLAQATCIRDNAKRLIKKEKCTLPWYWKLIENDPENEFRKCNESNFLEPGKDPVLKYLATVPQPNDTCKSKSSEITWTLLLILNLALQCYF